jgi:hypothetical protein
MDNACQHNRLRLMLVVAGGGVGVAGFKSFAEYFVNGVHVGGVFLLDPKNMQFDLSALRKIDRIEWAKDAAFEDGTDSWHKHFSSTNIAGIAYVGANR